jgi:hypothetical protein
MKKLFILLLLFVAIFDGMGQPIPIAVINPNDHVSVSQDIDITAASGVVVSLRKGDIETKSTLNFSNPIIELIDITIKAKKIVIKSTVSSIRISGAVTFNCEHIEFEGNKLDISPAEKGKNGEIIISYTHSLTSNATIVSHSLPGNNFSIRYEKRK